MGIPCLPQWSAFCASAEFVKILSEHLKEKLLTGDLVQKRIEWEKV